MKIYIGADHRGYALKKKLISYLGKKGFEVIDEGTHQSGVSCDYPRYSYKVASQVSKNPLSRGILVCMTGIGHSIAANKVRGVRAALCYNKRAAFFSRAHNDANVLVLGARFVKQKELFGITLMFLKTPFEGGRHLRRVNQIKFIEKKMLR